MEKLIEIYDEETVERILDAPYYDEEKLCSLIPYICDPYGELDEITEAKINVLALYPSFFFQLGEEVDSVPDVRPFSEETRKAMNVSWYPWLELQREFTRLYEEGEEDDENIYYILFFGHNTEELIWNKDDYEDDMKDFFKNYPVLTYILLLIKEENNNIAVAFDYPYSFDINSKHIHNSFYLAQLAQNRQMVDFLLKEADRESIREILINYHLDNPFVYEWLIDNGLSEDIDNNAHLIYRMIKGDTTFPQRDDIKEVVHTALRYGNTQLLEKYLERYETKSKDIIIGTLEEKYNNKYPLSRKTVEDALNTLGKFYGIKRFYEYVDTLKIALEWGLLSWIKKLSIEDLIPPIEYQRQTYRSKSYKRYKIHPILYFMEKKTNMSSKNREEIMEYLNALYKISPSDMLKEAIENELKNAATSLLNRYTYSNEQLKETLLYFLRRDY